MLCLTFFLVSLLVGVLSQDVGDSCNDGDLRGTCKNIFKCPGAVEAIKKKTPVICGFDGTVPVVCCVERKTTWKPYWTPPAQGTKRPTPPTQRTTMGTMTKRPLTTTTEYTPEEETYEDLEPTKVCPPFRNFTASRTDRKAWKKCLQYQEDLVFPCEDSKALLGGKVRGSNCKHNVEKLIVGGVDASEAEFPHMVMLSHSTDIDNLEFGCGGSIISDWFILTAAHCTYRGSVGNVTYAVLGLLNLKYLDHSRIYKIGDIKQHHLYNPSYHYHDIALLKTEKQMKLDMFAVPACLDIGSEPDDSSALVIGWGALWNKGPTSDHLQKVILNKFTEQECSNDFPPDKRRLPEGYKPRIQMCYGDKEMSKDACKGDSGGPLQLKMVKVKCMYNIIGVTSFGKQCGKVGFPGMYTRVKNYVSWIEDIVWPGL
ncbi:trypsin-1-like [Epargyreus clarus]|uniref:trypsin-1-like n=1 Tax=Epargyreus clarus TaxID=520877 RepID=UPI003C2D5FE9